MKKLLMMIGAAAIAGVAVADNLYWTGATDGTWSVAGNWWNSSRSVVAGNPPNGKNDQYGHSAYFDQTLAGDKSKIVRRTVSFASAERMRGSVYVYDGTFADPIVFSADDDFGLSVTNKDAEFQIGKSGQAGWLKIQGGTFASAQPLQVNNGGWIVDGATFSTTNAICVGNLENENGTACIISGTVNVNGISKETSFIIGNAANSSGTVTNVNGTIVSDYNFTMCNADNTTAYYCQEGGSLTAGKNQRFYVGNNSSSKACFELRGGTVEAKTVIYMGYDSQFLLNGGTVAATSVGTVENSPTIHKLFLFDGGTFKAKNVNPFSNANNAFIDVKVGINGGTIDTNEKAITVADAFESAVEEGADGGMKYVGGGSANITGAIGYTGPTTVEIGTLVTIADRANVFGEGKGGLRCSLPSPKPEGDTYTVILTTTGEDDFTASDLTKCAAAEGAGGISFRISGDGKSIMAKRSNGLIISFH